MKYLVLVVMAKSTFHYGSIKIYALTERRFFTVASTFHYGSIKICLVILSYTFKSLSTFHYGSIKINSYI